MAFPAPKKPDSLLGYYRILSPNAGVRVSPLCLGTMNFGEAWEGFMGVCNKETAFSILDAFYHNGGNFIDTANNYQGQQTEVWLGEWILSRKNRDELVVATKFTSGYMPKLTENTIRANYQGNHTKSLRLSVEASLKKLQTTYIDLLYVHWWDFTTSVAELMNSLHHLVVAGKVLYLGASDTPAWMVSKCNEYARNHSLTQFSVYQGRWSAADRDFERDILPMCESEGMALAPWGALGRGMLKSPEEFNAPERVGRKMAAQPENYVKIAAKLNEIAKAKGDHFSTTDVALAYVRHKSPYVFPIVGGRTIEHLEGNIRALGIELTDAEMDSIDDAAPFDVGFPLSFLFEYGGGKYRSRNITGSDIKLLTSNTSLESVPKPQPIRPGQGERNLQFA